MSLPYRLFREEESALRISKVQKKRNDRADFKFIKEQTDLSNLPYIMRYSYNEMNHKARADGIRYVITETIDMGYFRLINEFYRVKEIKALRDYNPFEYKRKTKRSLFYKAKRSYDFRW